MPANAGHAAMRLSSQFAALTIDDLRVCFRQARVYRGQSRLNTRGVDMLTPDLGCSVLIVAASTLVHHFPAIK